MSDIASKEATDRLLSALSEQVAALGQRFELVVVGGSALLALGLIERPTRDVDLIALRTGDELGTAKPLPPALEAARDRVARDFSLPAEWLNPGPTDLLEFGLPEGFSDRLERRDVDQGPGKHEADLRALSPTEDELLAAARWSRIHDPSEGYERVLREVLAHMGVRDADLDD
jgi:uncharacterized nucleotidyltransferase DUF6036